MGLEIERKFLVLEGPWRSARPVRYCQGYLNTDPQRTVRVRIAEDGAFLTVKGPAEGIARPEFEYPIPVADAHQMLSMCMGSRVEKMRRRVRVGDHVWEVDEFLGDNEGLLVAEIELEDVNETFEKPDWVGEEVTGDLRYLNSRLLDAPFKSWAGAPSDVPSGVPWIKACPVCGGAMRLTDTRSAHLLDGDAGIFHLLQCDAAAGGCGLQSGWYGSVDLAISSWNGVHERA